MPFKKNPAEFVHSHSGLHFNLQHFCTQINGKKEQIWHHLYILGLFPWDQWQ